MEKKNTILLTVIAIATLLVAAVGATFSYFTAQGGTGTTAKVTVSTGTAASSEISTFTAINIYADATTFAQDAGSKTGTSEGSIKWTAPGATGTATPSETDRTFCYTAQLAIDSNTFVYSSTNTGKAAELTLTAVKGTTTLIDTMDITTTTDTIKIPTTKGGSDYVHKLVADAGQSKTDSWSVTVTLVNLDVDQNDNTGKQFSGTLKFDKTSCS